MADNGSKENFDLEIPEGMTYYYLAILKKDPAWTADESAELDQLQAAHVANYRRLAEEGKLIVSGPLIDNAFIRGIDVFRTQSLEEAKRLSETDPMALSQRLEYEF
ncbi:MAG TPA: YciI family protein, partial [Anaerolineae bacterium]|nr:YciI family protein [Anaerolineae bacterium]